MEKSGLGKKIVIATKNRGKIREIKDFFKDIRDLKWLTYSDFELFPEVREGDRSFLENAKTKAPKNLRLPFFNFDTSLLYPPPPFASSWNRYDN